MRLPKLMPTVNTLVPLELNEEARLPCIANLIARKQSGENTALEDADAAFHQREYERLCTELQAAHHASRLPQTAER